MPRIWNSCGDSIKPQAGLSGTLARRPRSWPPAYRLRRAQRRRLLELRRTEFSKAEQLERAASVIVEHTEIVGLPNISLHEREMRTIALSRKTNRNLVGDELLDPLAGQLPDQCGVKDRFVAGQNDDRAGSGHQHVGFHVRTSPRSRERYALRFCSYATIGRRKAAVELGEHILHKCGTDSRAIAINWPRLDRESSAAAGGIATSAPHAQTAS